MKLLKDIRVGVDIGHGIDTSGKRFGEFIEHTFNSDIGMLYIDEMVKLGFSLDNFILAQKPNSKEVLLPDRFYKYNNCDFYFSIHADAFSNNRAKGMTIFHWRRSVNGIKLANEFKKQFELSGIDINFRNIIASEEGKWNNFGILREPTAEGILIEHGFMTNTHDRNKMSKQSVKIQFAKTWAKASVNYLVQKGVLDLSELNKDKGDDNMSDGERINIKIESNGNIIKSIEEESYNKVKPYLAYHSLYQESENELYKYCGYNLRKGIRNDYNNTLLQMALKQLGYYNMEIDNSFGEGTHQAVIKAQIKLVLPISGIVNEQTANGINKLLLELEKADDIIDGGITSDFTPYIKFEKDIKNYTRFGQVRYIQTMLKSLGYNLVVDGHFGNGSESAINKYKKLKGFAENGVIDEWVYKNLCYDYSKYQDEQDVRIDWYDNQTKVMRVKKSEVNMDVILGKQPTETVPNLYKRLPKKPLLLLNSGMFGMSNGVTLQYLKDDGKLITEGVYSKWVIGTDINKEIKMFGMNWMKQIGKENEVVDCIGASPSLLVGGKENLDLTGLDYGFINYKHPRLTFGLDDEYVYVIVVHGRLSKNGFYGATIKDLVKIGLDLNIIDLINFDGGDSVDVLDINGKHIDEDEVGSRRVDTMVALYKK